MHFINSDLTILITGCAGFIGMHLTKRLLDSKHNVIGIDNISNNYDQQLKLDRLYELGVTQTAEDEYVSSYDNFCFYKIDIKDEEKINDLFETHRPDIVINLAAKTGVRDSAKNPGKYVNSNINGFLSILEACKKYPVKHLIFASSSSVYGLNQKIPFNTDDTTGHPASIYAATKKSNELMAHSYSHQFNIPVTGLRFFTVYGPWYRPDMAMYLFADAIMNDQPIKVFNYGNMKRDFTYVDDITESIEKLMLNAPIKQNIDEIDLKNSGSSAPYQIFNIGNSEPIELLKMIDILEEKLNKKAIRELLPMQKGDIKVTFADVKPLENMIDFKPKTSIDTGTRKFAEWYIEYHS